MTIGYSVEGSTDRALVRGLQRRWCPRAELLEGRFRGTSHLSQRREIPRTCLELASKGAEVIVFLRDANEEDWRDVLKADEARCPAEHQHLVVFGVCARNVESWLCSEVSWIAAQTGADPNQLAVEDPKRAFEKAVGVAGWDRKEEEIASLVQRAPLERWLANKSFENFYGKLWQKSKQVPGCRLENLRERPPT
jgi:hypothetical protein